MSLILSGTDGISDVDGSASTPALRGTDANTGIFFPAADTIAFSEGGVESMRIDSSGNVGIGTSSPSIGLTVVKDNGSGYVASFRANTSSPALTIQTTGGITQIQGINSAFTDVANIAFQPSGGNVGIGTAVPAQRLHVSTASGNSFLQISSGSNNIYYGWENSRSVASVQSNTAITFDTGGSYTERMRIDSGGNVFVGKTSDNSNNQGLSFFPSGAIQGANNGAGTVTFYEFYRSGTRVGKIDSSTSGITVTGVQGITFTATQSASSDANTLDDYEEGTWTPVIGGSDGQSGQSYTTQSATYTKIGNRVIATFKVQLSTKGTISGTYLKLKGLPFTINSADSLYGSILYFVNLNTNWISINLQAHEGTTECYIWGMNSAGLSRQYPAVTDVTNTTEWAGTFIYRVA